jgi:hypothetical protein
LVSHSVGFAVIRSSHLFFFRNDSQSCYVRILLDSHWFVICKYSFFARIRSHVIFAFRWFRIDSWFASIRFSQWFAVMLYSHSVGFRIDSLFASIRFSQWFAVMLCSHSVGFALIRYLHLFVFCNDTHSGMVMPGSQFVYLAKVDKKS